MYKNEACKTTPGMGVGVKESHEEDEFNHYILYELL
jgi:hypothetical protein